MGERSLSWLLRILNFCLVVIPLLTAFASYGWDYKALVTPNPNPMEKLKFEIPSWHIESLKILNEETWEAKITMNSTLSFPFTIKNCSGKIFCIQSGHDFEIGSLKLKEEKKFEPFETGSFEIMLNLKEEGLLHLAGHFIKERGIRIEFRDIRLSIDVFGVSVLTPPFTHRISIGEVELLKWLR